MLVKPFQKRRKITSEIQQHFHEIPQEKMIQQGKDLRIELTKEAKCLDCVSRS